MGHPVARKKPRKTIPTFSFQTKRLQGVPKDSPAERAEKERLIAEFYWSKSPHGR